MPPKTSFTRDDIVNAAFELVCDQGLAALSARKVAERLHSSTQPVYSTFASMEELKQVVLEMGRDRMLEYGRREWTDRVFLNMGVGMLAFCQEHRKLYRAMFLANDQNKDLQESLISAMQERMTHDKRFELLPKAVCDKLLERMWIFTHGIASLICNGYFADTKLEVLRDMVDETGTAVIKDILSKAKDGS